MFFESSSGGEKPQKLQIVFTAVFSHFLITNVYEQKIFFFEICDQEVVNFYSKKTLHKSSFEQPV